LWCHILGGKLNIKNNLLNVIFLALLFC